MPKLPKFEDWKAPWELKDEEFDEEAARKYIYTLTSDKEKLQGKVADAGTKVTEAEAKVADLEKQLAEVNSKGSDEKISDLQAKLTKAESDRDAAKGEALRYSVALEEGLTKVQAKRLVGATEEELKADAEELLESFGGSGKAADEDDDEGSLRRTPRRLTNPGDRGAEGDVDIDIDKAIANIPRNTF